MLARTYLILALLCLWAPSAWANGLDYARAALEAEEQHDFERAIALYSKAIDSGDLQPEDLSDAYHYRGNARYFLGRYPEAAADYAASLSTNPSNVYAALWLYLARERSGQQGASALARTTEELDLFYWPGPVISLFLEQTTPGEVLVAAKDPFIGRKAQLEQLCEAYFYVGQYLLVHGRPGEAAEMFRNSLETRATDFVEYGAARIELARLGDSAAGSYK